MPAAVELAHLARTTFDTIFGTKSIAHVRGLGMAFAARLPADLDTWLDDVAAAEHQSKNAILVTALEEYRQRRELAHVLKLADETAHEHRNLLDRLGDA